MAGLIPGLQIFQPQEQTLDYSQQEPFLSALKRRILDTFMQQTQQPINVDQYFKPMQNQQDTSSGGYLQKAKQWLANNQDLFMYPQDLERIKSIGRRIYGPGSWSEMKFNPNQIPGGGPEVGPQLPFQPPSLPVNSPGNITPPPSQPPNQPQTQNAQLPFTLPGRQEQMSFEDYYKKMMSMQPQREKNWMDSPLYPLSMALMGIGQNLMTPPVHRGYVNPMAPMMGALQQQAQLQAQNDPRALFEKAVASYPHFIQATRTGTPKFRYVMDAQGNIKGVLPEGGATVLPQEQQPQETLIWTGDKYVRGVPGAKYIGKPTEDVERGYNVYDEATGANTWIPSQGKGPVLKRTRDIFQSMGQQSQGTVPVKNNRTGQIEMMPKEEARRRGLIP